MMKKLKKRIEEDISFELSEANKNYPLFASDHEGIAIIEEELEEATIEMGGLQNAFRWAKTDTFDDRKGDADKEIEDVIKHATNLACEAIQVAAMGKKWNMGRIERPTLFNKLEDSELYMLKAMIENELESRE